MNRKMFRLISIGVLLSMVYFIAKDQIVVFMRNFADQNLANAILINLVQNLGVYLLGICGVISLAAYLTSKK